MVQPGAMVRLTEGTAQGRDRDSVTITQKSFIGDISRKRKGAGSDGKIVRT